MISDELLEITVEQTNLYFQQNLVEKIFKKSSRITRYLESKHVRPFNQNNSRLYIATLLYRGVVHKPIYHMYYTNDKIFETKFDKILFPRINSYLLRSTSTLLIYQNLVKAIIVHPKFVQYTNISLSVGTHF